jgi:hypothetical protein
MVHCSGGAQTKVLHFVDDVHIIKDNLFPIPPLFSLIQQESGTSWEEMYKVFNMGHRMEIYVSREVADSIIALSKSFNIDAQLVGRVEAATTKKLTIQLPVEELKEQLISNLKTLFSNYQGDYNVTFEVLELEKVKRFVKREMEINDEISDEIVIDSDDEVENLTETIVENQMEEIEETIVKNKLEMPSRKLKISISKELLDALEKMQVNFKLN